MVVVLRKALECTRAWKKQKNLPKFSGLDQTAPGVNRTRHGIEGAMRKKLITHEKRYDRRVERNLIQAARIGPY